ncbi:hypothetical protein SOVF_210760 [Spinacia oleracea]|nr:hypothetical protein SOVF_210760 [Spinacia oleracea]
MSLKKALEPHLGLNLSQFSTAFEQPQQLVPHQTKHRVVANNR